jgi:SAM-dependent methyltransferase
MDLNPDSPNHAAPGVHVIQQDCSESWPLDTGSLDTVFTSNFFEHLMTKGALESTLQEAFRCLRNGGRLIAMGPNIKYVPGQYWDFFDHYLPLTEKSLGEVLEKTGFRIEKSFDRLLPYTMSQGRHPAVWKVRLYLSLPIAWRFLGKQFLIVAVKP